jgi:hypothetical protein
MSSITLSYKSNSSFFHNERKTVFIIIGTVLILGLIGFLIWWFVLRKNGSPGRWSDSQKNNFRNKLPKPPKDIKIPSSIIDDYVNIVSDNYSYKDAMMDSFKPSDKIINQYFGPKGHWNPDIKNFIIQEMEELPLSRNQKCDECIVDYLEQNYSIPDLIHSKQTDLEQDVPKAVTNCKNQCK